MKIIFATVYCSFFNEKYRF